MAWVYHSDASEVTGVCGEFAIDVRVADSPVHVECSVESSGVVVCNFSCMRRPYTFRFTAWSVWPIAFHDAFFKQYPGSSAVYGRWVTERDSSQLHQTPEQKMHMFERATRDVFACLSDIVERNRKSVLGYAVWFRENVRGDSTYAWLVTYVACCAIVHSNFLARDVTFPDIRFQSSGTDEVADRVGRESAGFQRKRGADDGLSL